MIKTYKVEHRNTYWTCEIGINHDLAKTDDLLSMVKFWAGGDYRLDINDGDVIKTFVQQLAREIFLIAAANNFNKLGVIKEFVNREGWCMMDGSWGITIEDVDDLDFDHDEFEVKEEVAS